MSTVADLSASPWACEPSRARAFLHRLDAIERAGDMSDMQAAVKNEPHDDDELYVVANGVATITIDGPMLFRPPAWLSKYGIAHTNIEAATAAVQAASVDADVEMLVLNIDSPGGMVTGTAELADAVAMAGKPVMARVGSMAASAAYWVAAQADSIVTSSATSEVGSIGVYTVLVDVSRAYAAEGIEVSLVSSGGIKGAGADGRVTADLRADTQRKINAIYDMFKAAVASGRGNRVKGLDSLADGRTFLPSDAIFHGLVDAVESPSVPYKESSMNLNDMKALRDEFPALVGRVVDLAADGKGADEIRALLASEARDAEMAQIKAERDAAVIERDEAVAKVSVLEADLATARAEADAAKAAAEMARGFARNTPSDPGHHVSAAGAGSKPRAQMSMAEKAAFIKAHGKDAFLALP
jgi:signal peptide peptidase SppA